MFCKTPAKKALRRYPVQAEGHLVSVFDITGLVVVIIALVFIWIRRNKEPGAVRSRRRLGLVVAGLGAALLVASLLFARVYPFQPAAVLITLFGLLYWLLNRVDKT